MTTKGMTTDDETRLRPAFDGFIGALNSAQYDGLDNVFTADFRRMAPDFSANTRDEMIAGIRKIHEAYPDFHIVVHEAVFSGNLAFCQWTVTATATAEGGASSPIEIRGATMMRYVGDKISEEHVFFDSAQFAQQLGKAEMPHVH